MDRISSLRHLSLNILASFFKDHPPEAELWHGVVCCNFMADYQQIVAKKIDRKGEGESSPADSAEGRGIECHGGGS